MIYVDVFNFAIRRIWRRNKGEYDLLYCRDLAVEPVIDFGESLWATKQSSLK